MIQTKVVYDPDHSRYMISTTPPHYSDKMPIKCPAESGSNLAVSTQTTERYLPCKQRIRSRGIYLCYTIRHNARSMEIEWFLFRGVQLRFGLSLRLSGLAYTG